MTTTNADRFGEGNPRARLTEATPTKRCRTCGERRAMSDYHKHPRTADRLQRCCIDCMSQHRRRLAVARIQPEQKRCTVCQVTRKAEMFSPDRYCSDGLSGRCRACHARLQRERRAIPPGNGRTGLQAPDSGQNGHAA